MIVIKHRASPDLILLRVEAESLAARDFNGEYLAGALLPGRNCERTIFKHANLKRADLRASRLHLADFSEANLTSADLRGADLSGAVLLDADLTGAFLRRANLRGADLTGALLSEADIAEVYSDNLTRWPATLGQIPLPRTGRNLFTGLAETSSGLLLRARVSNWLRWPLRRPRLSRGAPNHTIVESHVLARYRATHRIALAAVAMAFSFAAYVSLSDLHGELRDSQLAPAGSNIAIERDPDEVPRPQPRTRNRRPIQKVLRIATARRRRPPSAIARPERKVLGDRPELAPVRTTPRVTVETRLAAVDTRAVIESRTATKPVGPPKVILASREPESSTAQAEWEPSRLAIPESAVANSPAQRSRGNQEFHYGSGYDMYRMPMGQPAASEGSAGNH